MQVVRTLQKAWRDPGSNRTTIRASGITRGLWTSFGRFCSPKPSGPCKSKKDRHGNRRICRHYCDPGALSGVVKGSSLESTTKTASKLAGSLSLAFSLTL